ncbi:Nose resistant to fluoxetine protein 6 [Eumeta japonica]|uniref:Nose resistant to fluoxetine protein 6 n=1 Tax=Eumeta variegata TaxID=151549 RepID=A0A4C1WZU0_EUMVA|nr:Nose resistant to fluoxetine protein 6 [Eumeta japonica]
MDILLIVHDSSAKLPSGLLNGNVNQFGDFDQCLGAERRAASGGAGLRGKYCLASLQLRLQGTAPAAVIRMHRLMHSNYLFTSDLDDPGHRVPRFSSVQWGVCVPSACGAHDVRAALAHRLAPALAAAGLQLEVRLDEQMCQVLEDEYWPLGTVITGRQYREAQCVKIYDDAFKFPSMATGYLFCRDDVVGVRLSGNAIRCLSLKQNISKLVSDSSSPDDIGCVHGIRFINSVMLILSHKSMAAMYLPFANRTRMSLEVSEPWAVLSRAASLYTDPFLMLSGLLSTTALLRRFDRQSSFSLVNEYISRFIRLAPSLAVLMLFCTWLMPWIGRGPLWPQVVTHHADICKRTWWRNLLFVHNYFGFKDMCLTHTHHVGIDAQLFAATPLAARALVRWPRRGVLTLLALAALSTLARFVVTYHYQLSNFVAYGTSVKQLFATADHMYILPAYRATVYIMGVVLGYLLYSAKDTILSKAQVRAGWAFAVCALCASFSGTVEMGTMGYVYNVSLSSHYAAVAPITWCAFFAWIIYVSHMGYHRTRYSQFRTGHLVKVAFAGRAPTGTDPTASTVRLRN